MTAPQPEDGRIGPAAEAVPRPADPDLRHGTVQGVFSLGTVRMGTNLAGALALVILAHLLTPRDFGIVAIASAVLGVVQSSTELSLSQALIQKDQVRPSQVDTAWTMSLIRSVLLVLLFLAIAWPLSLIYAVPGLIPVLVVSGATGAVLGLQNPFIILVTKDLRFWPLAIYLLALKVLSLGLAIALALMLRSYWAIIAGNALGAVIVTVWSYLLVPYRPRFCLRDARDIWSFSGWMFFKQVVETLNWRIDQLIIGAVVSKPALGIYAMADSLAVIPARETLHPIRWVLFPSFANLTHDAERLKKACLRAQSTLPMVAAPLGIGLALVAEPAVQVMLGPQWSAATPFVSIAAILYTFSTFSVALQPAAMAVGRTRLLFLQQVLALAVKVPLLVAGLLVGGLLGAALGRCLAELLSTLFEMVATRILTGIRVAAQLAAHATTIAGLIAMAAAILPLRHLLRADGWPALLQLALEVTAGGLGYVGAVLAIWHVTGRRDGPVTELLHVAARAGSALQGKAGLRRLRAATAPSR
ncbi:lipopolysaccharide biosynthesis protein [Novosphingobium flavum]|uniref:Lipopolysaccharide biosynthesis protein n=1 Tax=Novosphingobium flavum TaxID=1778672 RepID=A0A7X1FQL1_9SPHN|nr:lipopolysaccharide biosynthesis protein [Novosphingobium flavum]MBC2665146.1 lipopolysaccharide biosynthesis protein [Novosphingobium flavum]